MANSECWVRLLVKVKIFILRNKNYSEIFLVHIYSFLWLGFRFIQGLRFGSGSRSDLYMMRETYSLSAWMLKDRSFVTLNWLLVTTISTFVKHKDENILFVCNKLFFNTLTDQSIDRPWATCLRRRLLIIGIWGICCILLKRDKSKYHKISVTALLTAIFCFLVHN